MMTMMILIIDSLHVSGWSVQHCGLSIKSPWTQLKQLTAPSQDFCGYKRCRYHSLFSFRDWLRIWRRLNCSPLKSLTCSCIDFSLYNRPWRRGFGKSVWGMENALFVNLRFVSDKRLDIVLSITLNAFSRTQELWIPSNHTHPCFLAFVIIAAIRKVR